MVSHFASLFMMTVVLTGHVSHGKVEYINPKRAEDCMTSPDPCVHFSNVTIHGVAPGKYVISGIFTIKREIREPLLLRLKSSRCTDGVALDACAPYLDMDIATICDRLQDKGTMWSGFLDHVQGDFQRYCPIKTGTYSIKDYSYEIDDFENLPLKRGFYRNRAELVQIVFGRPKKLVCFDLDFEVLADE